MTRLDQLLQRMRIGKALHELTGVKQLLDIGTHDGSLFRETGAAGVGIDPELIDGPAPDGVTMVRGFFPGDMPSLPDQSFDAATALAVVEHIPEEELSSWAKSLAAMISSGGAVVITVPAPTVDKILHVLIALRLIAGIEAHQHHGFKPSDLETIFTAPHWRLRKHQRFQLGLNHLYVFERTSD
ncbi:MAG TPA: methyltransferase domain-containing protein [Streptosporangiaceae bacterium]